MPKTTRKITADDLDLKKKLKGISVAALYKFTTSVLEEQKKLETTIKRLRKELEHELTRD